MKGIKHDLCFSGFSWPHFDTVEMQNSFKMVWARVKIIIIQVKILIQTGNTIQIRNTAVLLAWLIYSVY